MAVKIAPVKIAQIKMALQKWHR